MRRTPRTCAHCLEPMQGFASAHIQGHVPLCRPDVGLDCYRLVTLYGHPLPCFSCASVQHSVQHQEPELPEPECRLGYTNSQVRVILGPRWAAFATWMLGQTSALCGGEDCPVEHGFVIYRGDVERFIDGRPIID